MPGNESQRNSSLVKIPEPKPVRWSQLFWNAYGAHEYRFEVGLPVAEIVRRLKEDTIPMYSFSIFSSKSFRGSVKEDTFDLTWVNHFRRNSWDPVARGRIDSLGERSRISLTFEFNQFTRIFMMLWMLFACVITVSLAVTTITSKQHAPLFAFLFPVFGTAITAFGVALGRSNQKSVLKYFSSLPDSTYIAEKKLIE